MCCNSLSCKCSNREKKGFSVFTCQNSDTLPALNEYDFNKYRWNSVDGIFSPKFTWNNFDKLIGCTCKITSPEQLLIQPYKGNESSASKASFGETEGLYPQKNPLYNPELWDIEKTKDLLKCRAAIDLVSTRGEKFKSNWPKKIDGIYKVISPYHLKVNFPVVDDVILNDEGVKWFFLDPNKNAVHAGIDKNRQEIVKYYGPVYNVGGGDVKAGNTYVIFYRLKK